jgi:hypothetical protein
VENRVSTKTGKAGERLVARRITARKHLVGWRWDGRPGGAEFAAFRCVSFVDDSFRITRIERDLPRASADVSVVELRNSAFEAELVVNARTSEGFDVSLRLTASLTVADLESFAEYLLKGWLRDHTAKVDAAFVGQHLSEATAAALSLAMSGITFDQLHQAPMTVHATLGKVISEGCAPHFHLQRLSLDQVRSAAGEAYLAQLEAERLQRQQDADRNAERLRVSQDLLLETEAALAEAEAQRARLAAQSALEESVQAAEIRRLNFELDRRKLQAELDERDRIDTFVSVLAAARLSGFDGASQMAAFQTEMPADLMQDLADVPATGIGPRDVLMARVLAQRTQTPGRIAMARDSLGRRDLALRQGENTTTPVQQATIGSSLSFRIAVERAGYLTLIINGSSGRSQLVVPNAFIGVDDAFAGDGEVLTFPGRALLGRGDLDLFQQGPAGWEEIIVILSDQPLIGGEELSRALADGGFLYLDEDNLRRYASKLSAWTVDSWGAAALGYQVVGH